MGSAASRASDAADERRRLTRAEAAALAGDQWDASKWPSGADSITVAELRRIGVEGRLLPPPPAVQLWLAGEAKFDPEDGYKVFYAQVKAALPWLKAALVEAWRSAAIKSQAKTLLRIHEFTTNLYCGGVFEELQAHCGEALRALGAELNAYYEQAALCDTLGSLALLESSVFGACRRLDNPDAVGLPLPPRLENDLDFEWERVVTHVVRCVASAVKDAFQAVCARVAVAHSGEHKPTPIKGHARIVAKATSDHRNEARPRPALNIDVVRCACTFDTPAQLEAAARALCAEFGGAAARVKNGFAPEVDGAASYHYRTLMVNWIFAPGQTYAELAASAAVAWDRYLEAPPDPTEPWGRWRAHAARALAWLRSAEVGARPVRFVCETQLLLRPYLVGRLKMHLLYKVVRAADGHKLHAEFEAARWAEDARYEDEQRAARDRALARLGTDNAEADDVLWNCVSRGELEAVRVLIERGTDVDKTRTKTIWRGYTPLIMAAHKGHADCVRALLERGANVDKATTKSAATPLYVAATHGHVDCVCALLEQSAEVDKARTDDGTTPLYISCSHGHADCVLVLLKQSADVDKAMSDNGITPLWMAAAYGYADCVCTLLERGADVDAARTDDGATPLAAAATYGHTDCVHALLERRGTDVDKLNHQRQTPINIAAYNGHAPVVAALVAAKACLAERDVWGGSPLTNAEAQGHDKVAELIRGALLADGSLTLKTHTCKS